MSFIRDQITETINTESIKGVQFVRLNQWRWVLDKLAESFLERGRADLEFVWLWERFKQPYISFRPEEALETLEFLLEGEASYWLIASEENGKFWVLDSTGSALITLMKEMSFFEYYIVDKGFSMLLCETHHGDVIAKGSVENKMRALSEFPA